MTNFANPGSLHVRAHRGSSESAVGVAALERKVHWLLDKFQIPLQRVVNIDLALCLGEFLVS